MADITSRTLGRTGVEVSTLGYGSMELRGGDTPSGWEEITGKHWNGYHFFGLGKEKKRT